MDIVFSQLRTSSDKTHFRHFAKPFLPESMVNHPKRSIAVPIGGWLSGPLRDFASDLLSPSEIGRLDILNADGVGTLLTQHMKGQANNGMRFGPS